MRKHWLLIAPAIWLVVLGSSTMCVAGENVSINVTLDAADPSKTSCADPTTATSTSALDEFSFVILDSATRLPVTGPRAATVNVALVGGDGQPIVTTPAPIQATQIVTTPAGSLKGATVKVTRNGVPVCEKKVAATAAASAEDVTLLAALNDAAEDWLEAELDKCAADDPTREEYLCPSARRDPWGGDYVIYHLPDGTLARPMPVHISEEDTVRIVMIVPDTALASMEVIECGARQPFRILGSRSDIDDAVLKRAGLGIFQSKDGDVINFRPVYTKDLQCADKLRYRISISQSVEGKPAPVVRAEETTIGIDPVYTFAWGAGFGFDFGSPTKFQVRERSDGMGGMQSYLDRDRDTTGLKPVITLTVYPFGGNRNDWSLLELLSPFIGVDPTRIDSGFVTGLNLAFLPSCGLLLGASVFESEKLSSGAGLSPGDTVPQGQSVAKREVFNSDGVGFFMGINFTTDAFQALLARTGAGGS